MRVLHVITGLAAGGAEQQLRALLPHLTAYCEVAVLTNPGVVADAITADGVPVHHLGMRGNRDLTVVVRLARLMRQGAFQVVHTHLYRACVYGRLAARLAGIPVIVATEHSIGATRVEGRKITAAVRVLYLASELLGHTTVAVSRSVADRLGDWGVPRSRIEIIANGIDGPAFRFDQDRRASIRAAFGLPPNAFVIGGVGRLEHGKRFDLLLDVMADMEGAYALIVGTGTEQRALQELARRLGIADRAVFAGEATNVAGLLSAMDVLVAPSQEETFGLAVLEGLAAGLPVLYTTCPAVDDLPACAAPGAHRVPHGRERLRIELRELAATGAVRLPPPPAVDHYDIRRQAERFDALYQRLLNTSPSGRADTGIGGGVEESAGRRDDSHDHADDRDRDHDHANDHPNDHANDHDRTGHRTPGRANVSGHANARKEERR